MVCRHNAIREAIKSGLHAPVSASGGQEGSTTNNPLRNLLRKVGRGSRYTSADDVPQLGLKGPIKVGG